MQTYMKIIVKKSMIIMVLIGISATALAAPSTRFTVNGMVCAFCAQGIEKKLSKLPQVQAVYINLAAKIVVVEPKDGMTIDSANIVTEIKDAGYDVVATDIIPESVADIRKSMEDKP